MRSAPQNRGPLQETSRGAGDLDAIIPPKQPVFSACGLSTPGSLGIPNGGLLPYASPADRQQITTSQPAHQAAARHATDRTVQSLTARRFALTQQPIHQSSTDTSSRAGAASAARKGHWRGGGAGSAPEVGTSQYCLMDGIMYVYITTNPCITSMAEAHGHSKKPVGSLQTM